MKAIIVDDEQNNQELISNILKKHCQQVTVLGIADSVDTAYELIVDLKPDLVFLDIGMPEKNGFDLLRKFKEVDFSVIFVTGFNEYAIKAFKFNAVDYILKPINYLEFIEAVKKAEKQINSASKNLIRFVHSLEEKTNYLKRITLHKHDKVHVLDLKDVVYISANRGYSEIFDAQQHLYTSAKPLADYTDLLHPLKNFIRVNKSYIINAAHVDTYSKGAECVISMKGSPLEIEVSRRKKTEIIQALKESEQEF